MSSSAADAAGAHGVSKLTDFGIAVLAGDRPQPTGTLRYMPPEQFEGAPASPAADVYAATVTFYQCLTGQLPFDGQTATELYDKHKSAGAAMEPVPGPMARSSPAGWRRSRSTAPPTPRSSRPSCATRPPAATARTGNAAAGRTWPRRRCCSPCSGRRRGRPRWLASRSSRRR